VTGVLGEEVALLGRRKFAIRRTETMRDRLIGGMVLAAVLTFSSLAMAQAGLDNNMYNKLKESGPGGPAPKRDFTGSWAGPLVAQKGDDPSLTPEGQKLFSMNKPEASSTLQEPMTRLCARVIRWVFLAISFLKFAASPLARCPSA
jgi:hypothetical protein